MFSFWKKDQASPSGKALIHEPLQPLADTDVDFHAWQDSLEKRRLVNQMLDAYLQFEASGNTADEAIDYVDTPRHRGFILHLDALAYSLSSCRFMLEFFREKLRVESYRLATNDVMARQLDGALQSVYRYQLKPRGLEDEKLKSQRYGNISLELHVVNDKPLRLQCLAGLYSDRMYKDPEPFRRMLEAMLL